MDEIKKGKIVKKKRPVVIILVSIIEILLGIVGIFIAFDSYYKFPSLVLGYDPAEIFLIIFDLFILTAAIFTFLLKPIGRILQLVFLWVIVVYSIELLFENFINKLFELTPLCLAVGAGLLIFYFTRHNVKEQFKNKI